MAKTENIYGLHTVHALLTHHPEQVLDVFVLNSREDERLQQIIELAKQFGLAVQAVNRDKLDQLAAQGQHQGVVARARSHSPANEHDLAEFLQRLSVPPFLLVLDNITDPHNLGACLRTAESVGVHAVITPKDKSAALNAVARKTASGAAEVLPLFQVTNLARTLKMLADEGVWLVGTALTPEAKSVYDIKLTGALAIVMGAEGTGMRRLTREHCDTLAYIPMQGTVQSLNVSVATGIVLYEAFRQRSIG
ncbi:23S rRNA (guanosine(2251)-2'-O)-methyltransferase RlmB [Agitococcus lubricus]|uniref:23S rRNA (guanosine-2'-O-)-methyltransferase RlmB n=1 Tax=Agitococcus lubricus TaxID=1077255 RepID=A0A2T5J2Y4_9GAMM|nr:23S rRNA (guanosine(2251)-2'-O)-methyltransferase RlmB [Agitococcus lubricus]PTQ90971.1 23S rRNA Gm-2251 2'-O-methyltransferase [Agitococcus lubricus]